MTTTRFHKMHGLGNDFVVIDARSAPVNMPVPRAAAIANRRTGIGCDQLILLETSTIATLKMRIFNADGGEVEACGNATRCVALLLGEAATIETKAGILRAEPGDARASVTLGQPAFDWELIPLAMPIDTRDMPVSWDGLDHPAAVNVGNPHVIFFVEDCDTVDLERLGPLIENDPLFPERINVNVASLIDTDNVKLRVWERGVGLTRACGTGACATAVAAIRSKRVQSPVTVRLPGGELVIEWAEGDTIKMSGPAAHVFTGEADWDAFG
jgi:diaminopimelate epimerase